ncbi:MAG: hypothetical protein H5T76_24575 [Streptomyces sp.]|nr:hypothetical protein [Streptomyces sp.]
MRQYLRNVLVALDQFGNALIGGSPDETISSVLGKAARGDYGRGARLATAPLKWAVDLVFRVLGEREHCAQAIEADEGHDSLWMTFRR